MNHTYKKWKKKFRRAVTLVLIRYRSARLVYVTSRACGHSLKVRLSAATVQLLTNEILQVRLVTEGEKEKVNSKG